ncbi:MAG: DUF3526 domain-containing protein [Pseudomonadota bacterium]
MIGAILRHERLSFLFRGPALLALALVVVSFAYAGWSGDRWRDARLDSALDFETQKLEALADYRQQLIDIETGDEAPGPYDANPMSVTIPAVLPPAALADFAVGQADLHPSSAEISTWRNLSSVFGRYQFDNPTTLASTAFDLALVIIVLMPVLMIAVSFDVLAGERSRGTLAMILASPVTLSKLVWTRLAFRNGLIWLIAIAVMAMLVVLNDAGGDRLARFGLWLGASLLYALFWFVTIAFCVSRFRSATATAGSLVGLWLLFTLALPATFATLAESLYPTPSRLAFLSEIREAQGNTNRNLAKLTEGFLMDHPDLTVGDEGMPSYLRAAYLSNEAARESTRPIVDAYEAARAGRDRTIRWAQFLSPSIIAQRLLIQSAGADLGRQFRFQNQVHRALADLSAAIGPSVVSRNRMTLDRFDELNTFTFDDVAASDIARAGAPPAGFLLV